MNRSRITLIVSLLLFNFAFGIDALGQHTVLSKSEITKRKREQKAKREREKRLKNSPIYQQKQELEKRKREMLERAKNLQRGASRPLPQARINPNSRQRTSTKRLASTKATPSNFRADEAGRPAFEFAKFVHTAKRARGMDELLPFLTKEKQKLLAASSTNSTRQLKAYRIEMNRVVKVISEEVRDDMATVRVVMRRETDGKSSDLGVAKFILKGQGNRWRVHSFTEEQQAFSPTDQDADSTKDKSST